MASFGVSSGKGTLALLRESDATVIHFALKRLENLVETFWHEVSEDLPLIEKLHDTITLPEETRKLAALVASRVYFHLGAFDSSVHFALAAGSAFQSSTQSLFTHTILHRCIDQYVRHQEEGTPLDPRLESLSIALTQSWVLQNDTFEDVKEMIGFTIRARRLDFLSTVLTQYNIKFSSSNALAYTFKVACQLRDIKFRREILRLISELSVTSVAETDYYTVTQCLLFLRDTKATASLMSGLLRDDNLLAAYQLAFDIFENADQGFLSSLLKDLENLNVANENVNKNLLSVLCGEKTVNLYVKVLCRSCAADVHILNQVKRSINPRRSILHNFTVIADAFMFCGTTIDTFLRHNMDWLAKASFWSMFTCTAAVGVIHRGHVNAAMNVLEAYLPKTNSSLYAAPFSEAGSLYGLGLIYAPLGISRSKEAITRIKLNLTSFSGVPCMVHGASLGLGLAAIGLQDEELYDTLFNCLTGTDAVGGEAAAVGIGLLMLGSGHDLSLDGLKNLATANNQKEKIIRGCMMASALIELGREDDALPFATELLESSDPWIRLGGCFVLGMAYAGTQNNKAIERLLLLSVKDTFDEVRRNAVMMIGFVTSMNPEVCLGMVKVLMESYNPHVRYGVVMALAVSAAGSGLPSVVETLWEMKDDSVPFVRQGIYIALAMVLVQVTEKVNPIVKEFRQLLESKIADTREDTCSKLGCILATGLLDFGGRNCTFALHRKQHRIPKSTAGMFLFMQYWNWYPYILMISLAAHPTCFIGLNEDLDVVEYQFQCNAPPSLFAVPKSVQQEKKEMKAAGVQAVVLSTTRKEEQIRLKKLKPDGAEQTENSGKGDKETEEAEKKNNDAPELCSYIIKNTERVTAAQFQYITHNVDPRYRPLSQHQQMGVCLLQDTNPKMGDHVLLPLEINEDDAPPPKPFPYP